MESGVQLNTTALGIEYLPSDFKPTTGLRGVYSLREPFKTALSGAIHTCTAIRRLSTLIAAGEDALNDYYIGYGLTKEDYERDIELDKDIVTIMSDGGAIVHFPVGYMEAFPNMNGEVYQRFIIQIGLPPFPRATDFAVLEGSIRDVMHTHLGIDGVVIAVTENSELQLVPNDTHAALSAMRSATAEIPTTLSQLEALQSRYESLLRERDDLLRLFEERAAQP